MFNSAVPQLPAGSGAFNPTTCTSGIKTVSRGMIAGFSNVKVEYDVSFGGGGTTVSMVIREGTENTCTMRAWRSSGARADQRRRQTARHEV